MTAPPADSSSAAAQSQVGGHLAPEDGCPLPGIRRTRRCTGPCHGRAWQSGTASCAATLRLERDAIHEAPASSAVIMPRAGIGAARIRPARWRCPACRRPRSVQAQRARQRGSSSAPATAPSADAADQHAEQAGPAMQLLACDQRQQCPVGSCRTRRTAPNASACCPVRGSAPAWEAVAQ